MAQKEKGYVYILTNPAFREDWVKIGKSSRPVDVRSKELDNTAVPLPFEIYATMKTTKYSEAEKLIHSSIERFTNLRIRNNREFFNVSPEEALDIFKEVALLLDDAVIEETYKSSIFGISEETLDKQHKTSSSKTPQREELKKWMIPANPKYFDIAGCLNKYRCVYWRQHYNFQTGDIIYIYVASPECCVKYKCLVEEHDLPFTENNLIDREFFVNPEDFEISKQYTRFMKLKLISTTNSNKLSLVHLLENGMKWAPQGSINLSNSVNAELLNYVESNF
jgi:hypothetical protein